MARRFAFSELAHAFPSRARPLELVRLPQQEPVAFRHSLSKLSSALAESQLLRSQGAGADIRLVSGKKTRKQEDKKTRKQNLEDMKTRRQENRTILSQAQNVSGRTIVSYSRIPVFPSSKIQYSRILVFSSSKNKENRSLTY